MSNGVDDVQQLDKQKPRKRRYLQVGLRTLLVGVTSVAILFGCWHALIRPYQIQDSVRLRILALGGVCQTRPGPWYARLVLGAEHCQVVTDVDLADRPVVGSRYGFHYGPDLPSRETEYPRLLIDLGQLSEIERIDVSGCDVTDEILATWDGLSHLKRLVLSNTLVQDASLWSAWPLAELHVDSTPLDDEGLRPIRKYTSLTMLDASKTGCDDDTIAAWQTLESLNELNIADTRFSLRSRTVLLGFPRLTKLTFLGRSSSLESFERAQSTSGNSCNRVGNAGNEAAEAWVREHMRIIPAPRPLDFPGGAVVAGDWCYPGGLEYQALADLGPQPEVTSLRLDSRYVDDETLKCLAQFPNLRLLTLQNSWITDEGLRALANCPELEVLGLANTRITDAGLRHLSACPKLKNLILGGTRITHQGLAQLRPLRELRILHLPPSALRGSEPEMLSQLPALSMIGLLIGTWDRDSRIGEPISDADLQMILRLEMDKGLLFSYPHSKSISPIETGALLNRKNQSLRLATLLGWLRISDETLNSMPKDDLYLKLIKQ